MNTAMWTTLQSQQVNTAHIYQKIVKTTNKLQKLLHTSQIVSLKFAGKHHGPAKGRRYVYL